MSNAQGCELSPLPHCSLGFPALFAVPGVQCTEPLVWVGKGLVGSSFH